MDADSISTPPSPARLYVHDDLSDGVIRAYGEASEAYRLSTELIAVLRRDAARVTVLTLAGQLDRLIALGDHRPFAMAIGIGRAGERVAEQLNTRTGWFPYRRRVDLTREEDGHGGYNMVSLSGLPWEDQLRGLESAELEALAEAYRSIEADGHLIVIEGEAGIGKTRLAREFLSRAAAGGANVIATRCFRGETSLAYGPFIEALRSVAALAPDGIPETWRGEAGRLAPELAGTAPDIDDPQPLDRPGAQARFFEAVSRVLLSVSQPGSPGVLFIDDLHWADEASLDLLTYMVRRLRDRPLCILTSWRGDTTDAGQRLRALLAEARRSGDATSVSLARLTQPDVAALVGATAGRRGPAPGDLQDRLYRETEGLPFFIVEYLDGRAGGQLSEDDGAWEMPTSVRDLLLTRLASVGEAARQALDTAAVIGRSFDFTTVQHASGRREEETVAALDELLAQGLIREVSDAASGRAIVYDFDHEQLRALVYEETSLARRRLLHRRVAEAVAAQSRGRGSVAPQASLIAQHYRMAGRDEEAALHFKVAAEHARALFANAEAIGHYSSALVLGHADPAGLNEAIGDLRTLVGEYGAAISSYETAASQCEPDALAGVEDKLGRVYLRRGDWEIAASHFDAALAGLGDKGPVGQRSRLHADLSLTSHNLGDADRAHQQASTALELGEVAIDTPAIAQAHNILGILARGRGELAEAQRHLELSLEIAESLGDPPARVAALNNLALVMWGSGQHDPAVVLAERALALCQSQGDRHRAAALHNTLSDILHASGQPKAAMDHLKQAVATFAEIGQEAGAMQPEIWKLVEW